MIHAIAAPAIVERNMAEGRIGLKTGKGFLDYSKLDVETYRGRAPEGAGRHAGLHGPFAPAGAAGIGPRAVKKPRSSCSRSPDSTEVLAPSPLSRAPQYVRLIPANVDSWLMEALEAVVRVP